MKVTKRPLPNIRPCALGILAIWLAFIHLINAQPQNPSGILYESSGFSANANLGMEMYSVLTKRQKYFLNPAPVNLETEMTPYVRSEEIKYEDLPKPIRLVWISVGFVDLMNNISHAKAIDQIERGYFRRYIVSLAEETGERSLKPLPDVSRDEYWTVDLLNEQLSNFNQMVGIVVGIEMSHHYLGHFQKYKDRLVNGEGNLAPISRFLTEDEWEASVKHGVVNALNCGFGIDGVIALYESIDKMPARPQWTEFFLPRNVKVRTLTRNLRKLERQFFSGGIEL